MKASIRIRRIFRTSFTTAALAVGLLSCAGCQMAATGKNIEGKKLYEQGQYTAALQQFQQAVASSPKNADAYYNMAATFHRLGLQSGDQQQLAQAEQLYNHCLDYDPNHADCYRGLAVLLAQTGRADRAFNLLTNWATNNRESADPRIELARLYHEFGDDTTAKLHLDEAIRLDHTDERAWKSLAYLREQSGDYSQALANYQRSYQLNNLQPEVATRIASLQGALGGQVSTSAVGGTRTVNNNNTGLSSRY